MKTLEFDLSEMLRLFEEKRVFDLRGIGSRLIREAALGNDYAKAELGVIAYALHKIETKPHFINSPQWVKIKQLIATNFNIAKSAVDKGDEKQFMDALKMIIKNIVNIDNELGNYAQNVYDKAKVKQASLAYSYGLSLAQAAALTGADQKELQSYIGFTTMNHEEPESKNITQRVKELKEILESN
ncbi:Uncharacterised protein [uncultured archaeon]|nr:Uncharacterised protein [uncultured archaeon]